MAIPHFVSNPAFDAAAFDAVYQRISYGTTNGETSEHGDDDDDNDEAAPSQRAASAVRRDVASFTFDTPLAALVHFLTVMAGLVHYFRHTKLVDTDNRWREQQQPMST